DDPLACVHAIQFAYDYTSKFHKHRLLDLVGYRRYGHNEMDEQRATQPELYGELDEHSTVTKIFGDRMIAEGIVTEDEHKQIREESTSELQEIYESMKEDSLAGIAQANMPQALASNIDEYETAVPLETLEKLNEDLLKRPEGFTMFK